jgi:uncharacterized protein YkwD
MRCRYLWASRCSAPPRASAQIACLLAVGAAGSLGLPAQAVPSASTPVVTPAPSQTAILAAINAERLKRDLRPLRLSVPLNAAARQHSREMVEKGYFAHTSADGTSFAKRIACFYPSNGYRRVSAGENILWSGGPLTAATAVDRWMHSKGHRRNILNPLWREIGISVVQATAAPGVYHGLDVVVVTTDFGFSAR